MIKIDNYKAFHGVMRITPRSMIVPEFEIEADWLYKPEYKCWYGNGSSYGEDICTVVRDDTEKLKLKKTTNRQHAPSGELVFGHCPACDGLATTVSKYCEDCGQKLDWGDVE